MKEGDENRADDTQAEGFEVLSIEEELSPEIREKVLAKVKDIDEKGVAYTGVARSGVEPTFGLQIDPEIADATTVVESVRSVLENGLRPNANNDVYFNISGRSKNVHEQGVSDFPVLEKDKPQVYYGRFSSGRINIVFDKSFLKEVGLDFYQKHSQGQRTHSVAPNELGSGEYMVNPSPEDPQEVIKALERGEEAASYAPGTGFVAKSEIEPKYFLGVVIPAVMRVATPEEKEQYQVSYMIDHSEDADARKQEYIAVVRKVMLNVYKDRFDMLLPIYDAEGNLLWPQQMSYEEVKKFIEERDKKEK